MTRILLLLLLLSGAAHAAEPPPGLLALDGRPAPALELADMDGKAVSLKSLRGNWVIVHFWASWCGPCRKEMPALQRMATQLVPQQLKLLLVNTAETDDEAFAFMATAAPELNTLMDRDGHVTESWQPRGLPSSFLIDPAGRLRYLALGGRAWDSPEYLGFLRGLTGGHDVPK